MRPSVKSVQMWSFFWSVFSCIWTEYGQLLSKSPYLLQILENAGQKKLFIWTLFTQYVLDVLREKPFFDIFAITWIWFLDTDRININSSNISNFSCCSVTKNPKHKKKLSKTKLIHLLPMHPFSTPWKHQKTLWFSDVLRGWGKGALGAITWRPQGSVVVKIIDHQRSIQNPVRNLRHSFLLLLVTTFAKKPPS